MFVTQLTSQYKYYTYFQAFLDNFMDYPPGTNKYKIPDTAIIMAVFERDVEVELEDISSKEQFELILSYLKGAVIIHSHSTAKQTVEISICRTNKDWFLTKKITYILYEYLFEVLKVRKVNSRISSTNIDLINGFRSFGFHEIILPLERSDTVSEHFFYYTKKQWHMVRRNFSGANAQDKHHLNRLRAQKEPQSIPLDPSWNQYPDAVKSIALFLPEHKRLEFKGLVTTVNEALSGSA